MEKPQDILLYATSIKTDPNLAIGCTFDKLSVKRSH